MNFTFHDVSINTGLVADAMKDVQTLHSTMFLLIPGFCVRLRIQKNALHSTMFLLIPVQFDAGNQPRIFTFHDVSINTHPL